MEEAMHRFSREELLIGQEGLAKLDRSRVAVIGLGGVGSYTVEALARAGVGWLILVDYDEICLTNTNRQIHAIQGNYGRRKVAVMEERVKAINPDMVVVPWNNFVGPENLDAILHGDLDYVVDAIDTVASKVALIVHCVERKIPVISAMGAGNKLDPLAFRVDDISKTHTCPLAKVVRKQLRDQGIHSGVKVVYSTEKPIAPLKTEEPATCGQGCGCANAGEDGIEQEYFCPKRRQTPGSISYVPPIAGLIMGGVVIQDLLGKR